MEKAELSNRMPKKKSKEVNEIMETKVSDIMTKDCFTIDPEMNIYKLIKLYREKRWQSFPVVDKDKKLVGIISTPDLIRLL